MKDNGLELTVPANYEPRGYQLPFWRYMDEGGDTSRKRAVLVWHRRCGKSGKVALNFTIREAARRVGGYYHCFPEYNQGRKALWDGFDREGHRFLDWHIPEGMRKSTAKDEMKIELVNGSIWQIVGADNYENLVGPGVVGLILDEWATSDKYPRAWEYFLPMLLENGGWAIFTYTPRGRNHGWDMYQSAMRNEKWFCQLLTIEDTGVVSKEDIEEARRSGMSEDMIQQEFYCSFLSDTSGVLIPFEWIQQSLRRDVEYSQSSRIAGADIARFGDDRSVLVVMQGGQLNYIEKWKHRDTWESANRIMGLYKNKIFDVVAVDVIGIGAGVYDNLKNAGDIPCVAVNVAERASSSRFALTRDELWWGVREWLAEPTSSIYGGIDEQLKKEFIRDIQDVKYSYNGSGQIKVESKDDMKKRLGFSPDIGDAVCLTRSPKIKYKISQVDRMNPMMKQRLGLVSENKVYNPLTFGLDDNIWGL